MTTTRPVVEPIVSTTSLHPMHAPQKSLHEMIEDANKDEAEDISDIIGRSKSVSVAEFDTLKAEYQPYIDELLEWASSQENLDVYQMNAFYSATHELSYYLPNYWKTFTCQFIQTFGLLILLIDEWLNNDKQFCQSPGENGIQLKLLAFFLLSFLGLRLSGQIGAIAGYGMYQWGDKQPPFIHTGWIAYGLLVNYITLFGSFFISLLVVYVSQSALDMILNFVALYFVIELDDEMVTWEDFEDIEKWITGEGYSHFLSEILKRNMKMLNANENDYDEDEADTTKEKCFGCINLCWTDCGISVMQCLSVFRKHPVTVRNIFAPIVILAPILIAVCY